MATKRPRDEDPDLMGDFGADEFGDDLMNEFDKPDNSTRGYMKHMGREAASGALDGVKEQVRDDFWHTSRAYDDVESFITGGKQTYQDIMKELRPTVNSLKQSALKILPMTKHLMPGGTYDKLFKKLEASVQADDSESAQQREEDARNAAIEAALNLFQQSGGTPGGALGSPQNVISQATQMNAMHQQAVIGNQLAAHANWQTNFLKHTYIPYLKKDLEIKYRMMFSLKDIVSATKSTVQLLDEKLNQIAVNTALSDVQKQQHNQALINRISGRGVSTARRYLSGFSKKLFGNIKDKVLNSVTGGLDTLSLAASMLDSMDPEMMGADANPFSKKSLLGMGAGYVGKLIGKKAAGKVVNNLRPVRDLLEGNFKGFQDRAIMRALRFRRDNIGSGGLKGMLASLIEDWDSSIDMGNTTYDKAGEATSFDRLTHDTITTVIPELLAKQLARLTDLTKVMVPKGQRTRETDELKYDWKNRGFTTRASIHKQVQLEAFGDAKEQSERAARAASVVIGALKSNKKDTDLNKKVATSTLQKMLKNMAREAPYVDINLFRKIRDAVPLNQSDLRYADQIFKGINETDQILIARTMCDMAMPDGNHIDRKVINDLTEQVQQIRFGIEDSYRKAEGLGYGSIMKSDYDDDNRVSESLIDKMNNRHDPRKVMEMAQAMSESYARSHSEYKKSVGSFFGNMGIDIMLDPSMISKSGIDPFATTKKHGLGAGLIAMGQKAYGSVMDAANTEGSLGKKFKAGWGSFSGLSGYTYKQIVRASLAAMSKDDARIEALDPETKKLAEKMRKDSSALAQGMRITGEQIANAKEDTIAGLKEAFEEMGTNGNTIEKLVVNTGKKTAKKIRTGYDKVMTTKLAQETTQFIQDNWKTYRSKATKLLNHGYEVVFTSEAYSKIRDKAADKGLVSREASGREVVVDLLANLMDRGAINEHGQVVDDTDTGVQFLKDAGLVAGDGTVIKPVEAKTPEQEKSAEGNAKVTEFTEVKESSGGVKTSANSEQKTTPKRSSTKPSLLARAKSSFGSIFSGGGSVEQQDGKVDDIFKDAIPAATGNSSSDLYSAFVSYYGYRKKYDAALLKAVRKIRVGIGGVLSAFFQGSGNAVKGIGTMFGNIGRGVWTGLGTAAGGLFRGVGSLGHGLGYLGGSALDLVKAGGGAFLRGGAKLATGAASLAMKGVKAPFKLVKGVADDIGNTIVNPIKKTWAKIIVPKFVDVYRKNEIDPKKGPLLSARMQREGLVFFGDGKPVKRTDEISEPVYKKGEDGKPQEVISKADIEHGLVNVDNVPLGSLSKYVSGAKKTATATLLGGVGKVFGGLFKGLGKVGGAYVDVAKEMFMLGSAGAKGVGTLAGRLLGLNQNMQPVLEKMDIIIDYLKAIHGGGTVKHGTSYDKKSEADTGPAQSDAPHPQDPTYDPKTGEPRHLNWFGRLQRKISSSKFGQLANKYHLGTMASSAAGGILSSAFGINPLVGLAAGGMGWGMMSKGINRLGWSKGEATKFARGGRVPGKSKYGDKVPALLNSGELVLSEEQAERLASEWSARTGEPMTVDELYVLTGGTPSRRKHKGHMNRKRRNALKMEMRRQLLNDPSGVTSLDSDDLLRQKTLESETKAMLSGKRSVKPMKPLYVDVYRKDRIIPGKPLMTAQQQLNGVYDTKRGARLLRTADIKGPIIDMMTKQTLVTEDDIRVGLVDVKGRNVVMSPFGKMMEFLSNPLGSVKSFLTDKLGKWGKKLGMKALDKMGSVGKGIKKFFGLSDEEENAVPVKVINVDGGDSDGEGGILDTVTDLLGDGKAKGRGTWLRKGKALMKKFGRGKYGKLLSNIAGKTGNFGRMLAGKSGTLLRAGGGFLKGAAGKALPMLAKMGSGLAGKAGLGSLVGGLGGAGGGLSGMLSSLAPALGPALPWIAGAAAVAGLGYAGYRGVKGFGKENTMENLGIKDERDVMFEDRLASAFGLNTKLGAKGVRALQSVSPIIGLIKGIRGNDNPMTEKEVEQGRAKLQNKVRKGAPGYDRILEEYNKAVEDHNWSKARQLCGKDADGIIKSMWNHSITGKVTNWAVKAIFGDKNAEMTEAEIKKARDMFNAKIQKGDKNAEKLLEKFNDYVSEGEWEKARKIAGAEKQGLFGAIYKDSKGNMRWNRVIGAVFGPVGLAVSTLFDSKDPNAPMSENEVKKHIEYLNKQIADGNTQAKKLLDEFQSAVTEQNWKKARKLSGKEAKNGLQKWAAAGKTVNKWVARIGTLGLSMLFEQDQETAMKDSEIKKFRDKMQAAINKGDSGAQKKLDAFDAAVAKQDWVKARQIAKIPHKATIVKMHEAWQGFLWGNDEKEMSAQEIEKFRSSMSRKIEMGSKAAQRKLDAFEDAVGMQNWKKARAIAGAKDDGFIVGTAKKIGKNYADSFRFLFGGDGMAMSESEIKKARAKLQSAIDEKRPGAQKRLDRFEDFIADEKWAKARELVNMPYNNALTRMNNAVKGFLYGSSDKELTEQEIQQYREEAEQRIADGDLKAQKDLAAFNAAVTAGDWEKARKISSIKDRGVIGSAVKGAWDWLVGNKDREDCDKLREEIDEKSWEDETGLIDQGLVEFDKLVRRRKFKEAMEFGRDLKELSPKELMEKHGMKNEKAEAQLQEANELAAKIDKAQEQNNGWLHPIKEMQLGLLRSKVKSNPDKWSSEFFEEIKERLGEIMGTDEFKTEAQKEEDMAKLDEQIEAEVAANTAVKDAVSGAKGNLSTKQALDSVKSQLADAGISVKGSSSMSYTSGDTVKTSTLTQSMNGGKIGSGATGSKPIYTQGADTYWDPNNALKAAGFDGSGTTLGTTDPAEEAMNAALNSDVPSQKPILPTVGMMKKNAKNIGLSSMYNSAKKTVSLGASMIGSTLKFLNPLSAISSFSKSRKKDVKQIGELEGTVLLEPAQRLQEKLDSTNLYVEQWRLAEVPVELPIRITDWNAKSIPGADGPGGAHIDKTGIFMYKTLKSELKPETWEIAKEVQAVSMHKGHLTIILTDGRKIKPGDIDFPKYFFTEMAVATDTLWRYGCYFRDSFSNYEVDSNDVLYWLETEGQDLSFFQAMRVASALMDVFNSTSGHKIFQAYGIAAGTGEVAVPGVWEERIYIDTGDNFVKKSIRKVAHKINSLIEEAMGIDGKEAVNNEKLTELDKKRYDKLAEAGVPDRVLRDFESMIGKHDPEMQGYKDQIWNKYRSLAIDKGDDVVSDESAIAEAAQATQGNAPEGNVPNLKSVANQLSDAGLSASGSSSVTTSDGTTSTTTTRTSSMGGGAPKKVSATAAMSQGATAMQQVAALLLKQQQDQQKAAEEARRNQQGANKSPENPNAGVETLLDKLLKTSESTASAQVKVMSDTMQMMVAMMQQLMNNNLEVIHPPIDVHKVGS